VVVVQCDALNRSRVAKVSQILTLDQSFLTLVGKLPRFKLALLLAGIDIVLGK